MGKRSRMSNQEPLPEKPVPMNSSDVKVDGKDYTAIKEGLATVLFPKHTMKTDKHGREFEVQGEVFYNPIQQFNRDLSVLAIKNFAEIYMEEKEAKLLRKKGGRLAQSRSIAGAGAETGSGSGELEDGAKKEESPKLEANRPRFTILDALSATGLRALRYTLELPIVTSATANDLDPSAVDSIKRNIEYNKENSVSSEPEQSASDAVSKIKPSLGNAQHHMYSVLSYPSAHQNWSGDGALGDRHQSTRYEVIDLDPYGSAAPFLDAAIQAVSDGGLLCATCTDAGVWASTGYSEKCYSLYGGLPVKADWSHEAGLRLILHSIATVAGRVWVRVRTGPIEVKKLASTTMIVYNCDEGCGSWSLQRLGKAKENTSKGGSGTFLKFGLARAPTVGEHCSECGSAMHLGGPMWAGPLHSAAFVERFLSILPPSEDATYGTIPRITGMLQTALQEIPLEDSPFFYVPSRLSKVIHCESPSNAALRGALIGLGYKVGRSHCKPNSIKTNAPHSVVWEVMKRWAEQKPRKEDAVKGGTPGFQIMHKPRDGILNIVFDEEMGKEQDKMSGVVRYQVNPTANWGPMAKAGGTPSKSTLNPGTQSPQKKRRPNDEALGRY